ncbi:hypothetical protein EJ04DRAFT_541532 [Polyplosphaeria fusca]|uniref:ATP-dependent RNA helicase DHX8 n=1 Tax=Polyplosphaeria fusca TaxID=682080 RepID=A0A9P4R3K9_9PLEO|nr:hypothetical protein EJ04DRAFT_541532 [Polyplosphaeria fusca]
MQPPFRQIRAQYDEKTITVYQAYNAEIASAAVQHQRLDASPAFKTTRMTWIKPSWAWVLYRSGYSYKDINQSHVLAIRMTHDAFKSLLHRARLTHGQEHRHAKGIGKIKQDDVRVQWDPERSLRLGKLEYRSIQIGIPAAFVPEWVDGIVEIEDVTARARELKTVLDKDEEKTLGLKDLIDRELAPKETEFVVDQDLRRILEMEVHPDQE